MEQQNMTEQTTQKHTLPISTFIGDIDKAFEELPTKKVIHLTDDAGVATHVLVDYDLYKSYESQLLEFSKRL